jgi:iron complex outermembrane receptor protein
VGYRRKVTNNFSIDVAGYYTRYENLQTVEPGSAFFQGVPGPPHVVLPLRFENLLNAEGHGLELTGNWQVSARWLLNSSYTFGRIHSEPNPLSKDMSTPGSTAGNDPHVRAQVRSHVELSSRVAWDTSAYFVDRLEFQGIAAYTRVDSGLTWRCSRRLNLRIEGQNLLQDQHQEFIDPSNTSPPSEIRRSGYAQLTWRY